MKFAHPAWLWLLLLLPLAFGALIWDLNSRRARLARFADAAVWMRLSPELDWSAHRRKGLIWLFAFAFVILALARPQWGKHEEVVQVTGLDIMVVLDVSNSMEVEDVPPSRLKKTRHFLRSFLERLGGDRVGIVAFAGSAYLASPLTTDLGYVAETIDILGPKMVTTQGTDIGVALETAARALERGAEEGVVKPGEESLRSRVVLLVSDGEDQREGALAEAKALGASGARVFVVGVGSEKGGPIPTRDDSGQLFGYKRTRKGEPVISAFKPDALQRIAAEAGGRFWTMSTSESEVDQILAEIGALDRTEFSEKRKVTFQDRFQWPLMIAFLLFLLELSTPSRRLLRATTTAAVLWGLCPLAYGADTPLWKAPGQSIDVWSKTRKGVEAFQAGQFDEAQKRFEEVQSTDPSRPEADFNQGTVQSQKGDAEAAIKSYGQAAELARERSDDRVAAAAEYNLGNSLSRKGDFNAALEQYLSALDRASRIQDASLEGDIRKNIELLRKQKQQQQKQQKNEQSSKDNKESNPESQNQQQKDQKQENQKQQQEQQKQEQQAKDQSQDQKGTDPKRYEMPGRRQFKSQKLTPEDANRVMEELAAKERELQGRLKKQRGKTQTTDRDW